MAHSGPDPGARDTGGPGRPTAGPPRWVKVFGIVVGVLLLLFVVLQLVTSGEHGPGRHAPSGDVGTTLSAVAYEQAASEVNLR